MSIEELASTEAITKEIMQHGKELVELNERLTKVEKLLNKTDVKDAWELQIELNKIKRLLVDETPTGKEKTSRYGRSIAEKFKEAMLKK